MNIGMEAAQPTDQFVAVTALILGAGLIGGFTSFLLQGEADRPRRRSLLASLLIGTVAAFLVPAFLSMIRSDLITSLFNSGAEQARPNLLIFVGFCLIAALFADRFIKTAGDLFTRQAETDHRVSPELREPTRPPPGRQLAGAGPSEIAGPGISEAEQEAAEAKKAAQEVAAEVDLEAADDPKEPPPEVADHDGEDVMPLSSKAETVTSDERKILKALTKRTYRTRTGIAEDSGIPKMRISEMLEDLADRKLALPTKSPRTGGSRWIITKRGIAALNASP